MAAKTKNKTTATAANPIAFIDKVESTVKRSDSHELVTMMQAVVGEPPKMWGKTIVGFGPVAVNGVVGTSRPTNRYSRPSGKTTYFLPPAPWKYFSLKPRKLVW